MTEEDLFAYIEKISEGMLSEEIVSDDEKYSEFFRSIDMDSFFSALMYKFGVVVSEPEQLKLLRSAMESNEARFASTVEEGDDFGKCILEGISESAFALEFPDRLVRAGLESRLYPMAMKFLDDSLFYFKLHKEKLIIHPEKFHIPKNTGKLITKKFSDCTMTFNRDFDGCIEALLEAYPETWLTPKLIEVFRKIHERPDEKVSVDSVEIWRDGKIIAGEIGFMAGNTYASLSGFHKEDDSGTVQMALLGKWLFENGFAYWDLGMELPYKYRYGAEAFNRDRQDEFLALAAKKRIPFPEKEFTLDELWGEAN